ncbi:AbrB/MazE/SpoVT family DNA-binding domain-containing protein [uncultured Parasutterella sp.]|uniref:AbrB/MazE/SpoVT family DNA-binding domain-containing protein n=1 Tax=uncultured Parasutterella sp. TaxID=1263098 RepID=UPI0025B6F84A|nr:AbrB/MazE/SpoVT family DNA-binding domain-containing protein [uncultured Parasutterella sp.]
MATLALRKVGGSVVLTLPKTLLDLLNAKAGDNVEYTFDNGKLVIDSKPKRRKLPKYDLSQLLEEHKQIMPLLEEEYAAWDRMKPVGTEML